MAVTKVGDILRRCKKVLQEVTQNGTRWANEELLDWLNESYQAITGIKPDASSINGEITCVVGTRQKIPDDGLMLLDVVRNLSGDGMAVIRTSRAALDSTRRRWHGEAPQAEVEQFVFDDQDPRHFYVYPPALATVKLEIIYASVPQPHAVAQATESSVEVIRLPDAYAPAMVDYILSRAYAKDAEHAANLQRAGMHLQAWQAAIGLKGQVDVAVSPNNDGRPA